MLTFVTPFLGQQRHRTLLCRRSGRRAQRYRPAAGRCEIEMRVLVTLAMLVCAMTAGGETVPIPGAGLLSVLPTGGTDKMTHVAAFTMDRTPVTNGEFLNFVRHHPEWQRNRVPKLFADPDYLSHWQAPDRLGGQIGAQQPVTRVSWFAARAYCEAAGRRLLPPGPNGSWSRQPMKSVSDAAPRSSLA